MSRLRRFALRLYNFIRPEQAERELSKEIASHLGLVEDEFQRRGMTPHEARKAARRVFGGVEQAKERSRDERSFLWLEDARRDVRHAVRSLRRTPGFSAVAILTLALGIGANTAIFSLMDAVVWRSLPVRDPEQLVLLNWAAEPGVRIRNLQGSSDRTPDGGRTSTSFKYPAFERFRARDDVFSDLFAFAPLSNVNLSVEGRPEMVNGQAVSGEYFHALGIGVAAGRPLDEWDDTAGANPVVVISYAYWQGRFGGDPGVIGETISLNRQPFTLVGVMPPGFQGTLQLGESADVTIPIEMRPLIDVEAPVVSDEDRWWARIMGRLAEAVTPELAEQILSTSLAATVEASEEAIQSAGGGPPIRVGVLDGSRGLEERREVLKAPLFAISVVAGLLLLLCCANVAGLLAARGSAQQRELAIRLSLGSGRGRLIRQLLAESLMIGIAGGAAGLGVALALRGILADQFVQSGTPVPLELHLDRSVLLFTLGLSVLTGLVFGLAPALRGSRLDLVQGLKKESAASAGSRSRMLLGRSLVVGQVALSVLVLVVAGLFLGTVRNLQHVELGFNPDNMLLFKVNPRLSGYEGRAAIDLQERIRERLSAIAGVRSATAMEFSPASGSGRSTRAYIQRQGEEGSPTDMLRAAPNFFDTMEIPVLLGRTFGPADHADAPQVAVVSETFAREFFPSESPIGRRFGLGSAENAGDVEIIGVVGDVTHRGLRMDPQPAVYLAESQSQRFFYVTFALRLSGGPAAVTPAVREALRSMDPHLPLYDLTLYEGQIENGLRQELQLARLTSLFGLVGLALACVGLYGILSYVVIQRRREFGIRIALGAQRSHVIALVMRELFLVGIGVVLGILGALAGTRYLESLLFGLSPADPSVIAGSVLAMLVAGAVAAYLPARKASRVDPLSALRFE